MPELGFVTGPGRPDMERLAQFVDLVLHLDVHLAQLLVACGDWIYVILFPNHFREAGVVAMPVLSGDSLLFVVFAPAVAGLGDNTNDSGRRWAGKHIVRGSGPAKVCT